MIIKKTVSVKLTEHELLQLVIDKYVQPTENEVVKNVAIYSYSGEYIFEITSPDTEEKHD
jgi:hypothetical protein